VSEPDEPRLTKEQRVSLFIDLLVQAEPASTFKSGYDLLCRTLIDVEDEHSGVPSNPSRWRDDGRLYPPHEDMARSVETVPGVIAFRSVAHRTFIAKNGAILILDIFQSRIVLSKRGKDGKEVPKAALG
jgi:hypothetical protein